MNKRLFSFAGVFIAAITLAASSPAQTRPARENVANDTLSFLPPSDGVMVIDVRRLLNETLPQVFAGDSAKLAQINSEPITK